MHGTMTTAPDETRAYLAGARVGCFLNRIMAAFERADALSILFVGETILDEYRYVAPLAKPSKEFIIAGVEAREPESFLGGVVAASLHADWPLTNVVTSNDQVLRKTRFLDHDFSRKLFEVYSAQQITLSEDARAKFQCRLISGVRNADLVVVFDFGHGLIGPTERHILASAKFLAVNAQTNAGNHGFNPVTKYERADLVCIDEPEARFAAGLQHEASAANLAYAASERMRCQQFIITQGRRGATCWSTSDGLAGYSAIPSFATRAVDTIGAGDAFLAVTAPLIAAGLGLEEAAFVGNVAGAIKTDIIGHRRHVERGELMAKIEELLR